MIAEILITVLFILLLFLLGLVVWYAWAHKFISLKTFLFLLSVKFLVSFSFGLVYSTVYANSDTTNYYKGGASLWRLIDEGEMKQASEFLKHANINEANFPDLSLEKGSLILQSDVSFFMAKIVGVILIFTFKSYYSAALILAFISFLALLRLYQILSYDYTFSRWLLMIVLFLFPSIVFWTSGILKDTIILMSVCLFVSSVYELLNHRRHVIFNVVIIVIASIFMLKLRIVVLLILAFSTLIWVFVNFLFRVKDRQLKSIVYPASGFLFIVLLYLMYYVGTSGILGLDIRELAETAVKFQLWHTYLQDTGKVGSGYSLGELSLTPFGIIRVAFASLFVSLFRPFIWESHNAFMYLTSLEGVLILIVTLVTIVKRGFFKCLKRIFNEPFLLFCFTFSVSFLTIVGFISYNFGALSRYKVVGLVFYLILLALLYSWKDRASEARLQQS